MHYSSYLSPLLAESNLKIIHITGVEKTVHSTTQKRRKGIPNTNGSTWFAQDEKPRIAINGISANK
jgi:hypothetical protein